MKKTSVDFVIKCFSNLYIFENYFILLHVFSGLKKKYLNELRKKKLNLILKRKIKICFVFVYFLFIVWFLLLCFGGVVFLCFFRFNQH